jgi:hypothetical protein
MPADTGHHKPRWRRVAWWVAPPAVVVLGTVGFLGVRQFQDSGPFHVGTCFQVSSATSIVQAGGLRQVSGRAKPVDCGSAHDGHITRTARSASDCTVEGAWLDSREQVYCVVLSV